MKPQNKVIVVTGAGIGIGRELCLLLLNKQADVAGVDLNEEALNETQKIAGVGDDHFKGYVLDITDKAKVDALPEEVVKHFSSVDGLINKEVIEPGDFDIMVGPSSQKYDTLKLTVESNKHKGAMKKAKIILLLFLCVFYFNSGVKAISSPSIIGKWYGLKDGSPITVVFRNDHTMSIQTEAFSSLSFTCQYKIDSSVSPIAIDLSGIPPGMICAAIVNFSTPGTMEFYGFFGAPGQTQRPASIDTNPKRPEALYLKLSRDSKIIERKTLVVTPPKEAKLAFERNKRLGRGLNLNGLLDNNSGDKPIKPEYIKMIAVAGFNSVRLPITWSVHSSKTPPYIIEPAFFSRVDSIVNLCLQNGLAVSIDLHYYPYINMAEEDSSISFDDNIKRFYSLWEQIAEHYKNYPPKVYFDILNEPNIEMGAQLWNELIAKSIKLIRKTNPDRTILVGTPNLGQSWTIGLLDLPKDDWNLIVQIHYYLPHLFTHQGLAYARAEGSKGMQWTGTSEEKKPIESDLNFCAQWSKAHFRPINLGEFGVNENADIASGARYINFVREVAEKHGFSFHLWGFREIFRVFDEEAGKWNQPLLESLIPARN